jgi:hypothetical protein
MEKFGSEFRNKHPGSATIAHNMPAARLVKHFKIFEGTGTFLEEKFASLTGSLIFLSKSSDPDPVQLFRIRVRYG